jgi:cytosine/adenosine deaminase-related metal-dependent hydrolase
MARARGAGSSRQSPEVAVIWSARAVRFTNARVVTPGDEQVDSITVRGGRIDCLGGSPHASDVVVDLDQAIVFPGLINAHDHLELNSFGRLKWRPHHANVREWIADFQPRFAADPDLALARADTLPDRLWVGGLKNLFSGVTTVCHHNPLHRPLFARFPVRVVKQFRFSHSLQIDGATVAEVCRATPSEWPWVIHAAEGVDPEAAHEVDALDELSCLGPNTVLVHGVAIDARQCARVLERGASLIWCPTSNAFLFDRTADVRPFAASSRLAIGSDSRLSSAGDLLDELQGAAAAGQISAAAVARAVTVDAAKMLRLPCAGRLEPGLPADLTVLASRPEAPAQALVTSRRADVRLTMIEGQPLYGVPELEPVFDACRVAHAPVRVDDEPRLLARWIARRAAAMTVREPGLDVGGGA